MDSRLGLRLQKYAAAHVKEPRASTAAAHGGDKAGREGAYRLLENERGKASEIEQGPIAHAAEQCRGLERVLLIQDSSSVSVKHTELREALGEPGYATGWMSHTGLAVDPATREPLGVLYQERWIQEPSCARRGKQRSAGYHDKESARSERTSRAVAQRLQDSDVKLTTVADREA